MLSFLLSLMVCALATKLRTGPAALSLPSSRELLMLRPKRMSYSNYKAIFHPENSKISAKLKFIIADCTFNPRSSHLLATNKRNKRHLLKRYNSKSNLNLMSMKDPLVCLMETALKISSQLESHLINQWLKLVSVKFLTLLRKIFKLKMISNKLIQMRERPFS